MDPHLAFRLRKGFVEVFRCSESDGCVSAEVFDFEDFLAKREVDESFGGGREVEEDDFGNGILREVMGQDF